jgi:predicted RNA-binding Zn-ribbon protein involved in translation (DUF1610 family)
LADHPLKDTAEVEIICPRCGYRMMRTAARLRRSNKVDCPVCGESIVPSAGDTPEDRGELEQISIRRVQGTVGAFALRIGLSSSTPHRHPPIDGGGAPHRRPAAAILTPDSILNYYIF